MPDRPSTTPPSGRIEKLAAKAAQNQAIFQKAYPDLFQQLQQYQPLLKSVSIADVAQAKPTTAVPQSIATTDLKTDTLKLEQRLAWQISHEEYEAVLTKAAALTQLPPGKIDTETALYLEQQLSDLLGFQVATVLQNQELLHSHGTIRALPHLKRSPTDSLEKHTYTKAPFANRRGYFGWLTQQHRAEIDLESLEKYYVALPLYSFPQWHAQRQACIEWFALRKLIVINPHNRQAVVCAVADSYDYGSAKYQFGASPEVIIEGQCWSPESLGKVLLFFVVDETDTIPLGPLTLKR